MPPAIDIIEVRTDSLGVQLRPSLRAATHLSRFGFDKLLAGIAEGNLTVMATIVSEGSNGAADLIEHIAGKPIGATVKALKEPLARFVLALAGHDADKPVTPSKRASGGSGITYAEHFTKLYQIATGWLGWPPEQAWSATQSEIMDAYTGRLDMLKSIFRDGTDKPNGTELSLDEFRREFGGKVRAL